MRAAEREQMASNYQMQAKPGTSMVRMETQAITAIQVAIPRDLEKVKKETLVEVSLMGEDYYYAWEVTEKSGKKSLIEGMSIDGAMVLLRNWGNCAMDIEMHEERDSWTFKATFIDWEKGIGVPRLYRQRKAESHGKYDTERAMDIAFQIGQSKAQRNAIDKAMPEWLKRQCMEQAKNAALARYQDVPTSIARMRDAARKLGITDEELQRKVGKTYTVGADGKIQSGDWLPVDLALLAAVFRAIAQKQTTITAEFRAPVEPEPDAKTRSQEVADQIKAEAARIRGEASPEGQDDPFPPKAWDNGQAASQGAPEAAPTTPATHGTESATQPAPEAKERRPKRTREPGED